MSVRFFANYCILTSACFVLFITKIMVKISAEKNEVCDFEEEDDSMSICSLNN